MRDEYGKRHLLRRIGGIAGVLLAVVMVPTALAGCGAGSAGQTMTMAPRPAPVAVTAPALSSAGAPGAAPGSMASAVPADGGAMVDDGMGGTMTPADSAAWAARPDYVRSATATEKAYAYAIEHPEVVQWMPCYCGCAAMGHDSNLDCFVKPRSKGGKLAFEEHASYCDICVKTALTAKALREQGQNLSEIRQSVDHTFGANGVQGTPTNLPPSS